MSRKLRSFERRLLSSGLSRAEFVNQLLTEGGYSSYSQEMRAEARRLYLTPLTLDQKCRCHFCGRVMIRLFWASKIAKALNLPEPLKDTNVVGIGWDSETGKRVELMCATIEHLTPIGRGGDNSPKNVVACCRLCNRSRATFNSEGFTAAA